MRPGDEELIYLQSEATWTGFARTGFVDPEGSTADILAVQLFDRIRRNAVIFDFDESEALAATGIAVHDNLCALDFAEFLEQFGEVRVTKRKGEISNIDAFHNLSRLLGKPA